MLNLYDMLANAQNGNGMAALARQYGLSQQQAQAAVEAVLPAFSQGLKRNASDPYGLGAFLSALSTGQHAPYFDNAANAFSPQGLAEGNGILGHLFGSKDLSRAVAAQAAQATGIGQDVLKQMLPAIAAMIMGGLFKQTSQFGQAQAGGFAGSGNPLGEIIGEMMKQGGGAWGQPAAPQPQAAPQQPNNPFDNPFGKVLQDMLGGGSPQPSPQPGPARNPPGVNPWGKILEGMLGGAPQREAPEAPPRPSARPQPSPPGNEAPRNPYDDIFGKMFETGRKQRDQHQQTMESVVDQFLKGMDRFR